MIFAVVHLLLGSFRAQQLPADSGTGLRGASSVRTMLGVSRAACLLQSAQAAAVSVARSEKHWKSAAKHAYGSWQEQLLCLGCLGQDVPAC